MWGSARSNADGGRFMEVMVVEDPKAAGMGASREGEDDWASALVACSGGGEVHSGPSLDSPRG